MKKVLVCAFCINGWFMFGQPIWVANLDENKVGPIVLPEVLKKADGNLVQNVAEWEQQRLYWLRQFETHMYGTMPQKTLPITAELKNKQTVLGGKGIQYQWTITIAGKHRVDILGLFPAASQKVPVFLGLNFCGNHTTTDNQNIPIHDKYVVCNESPHFIKNHSQESSRGSSGSRWPYEAILEAGLGSITASCADFEEDHAEGYRQGVRSTLAKELGLAPEEWSALSAWAWGLSRMMDFVETLPWVDVGKVIVHGHSRLGKAALWAGANDRRFAGVISNNSGEGGAALTRRNFGEDLWRITTSFPHWFVPRFRSYAGQEKTLPFDQHILLALMAPRPLYVASAIEDQWADPRGEFLSAYHAGNVYALYGKKGLETPALPAVNTPVGQQVRYHLRSGGHDINAYDWAQYIKFVQELIK